MDFDVVVRRILELPEIAAWDDLVGYLTAGPGKTTGDWELPLFACRSVCGSELPAMAGACALVCLQVSIILVDDILDNDPDGAFRRLGVGRASNYALALQAGAFRLLTSSRDDERTVRAVIERFSAVALDTARGQHADSVNYGDEDDYWAIVRTKSTPFYGLALQIGSMLGGADDIVSQQFWEMGLLLGEIVQLYDDLIDVFQTPPKPDWHRPRNNLAILYALSAEHEQRDRMEEIVGRIKDPPILREAQKILLKCGAVSYCGYLVLQRHQQMTDMIRGLNLHDKGPMLDLLNSQVRPLNALLERAGAQLPEQDRN